MTLTEFLEARISEDEAFARKVPGMRFSTWNRSWEAGFRDLVLDDGVDGRYVRLPESMDEHICRWDPARVLAECATKRAIIEALSSEHHMRDSCVLATVARPAPGVIADHGRHPRPAVRGPPGLRRDMGVSLDMTWRRVTLDPYKHAHSRKGETRAAVSHFAPHPPPGLMGLCR